MILTKCSAAKAEAGGFRSSTLVTRGEGRTKPIKSADHTVGEKKGQPGRPATRNKGWEVPATEKKQRLLERKSGCH